MEEVWKPILGYEDVYEVSSLGRIRVLDREVVNHPGFKGPVRKGRILRPGKQKQSYLFVYLTKNGVKTRMLVHRAVAQAFVPNPDNLPFVDHIDTNPLNNSSSNLRWVSAKENQNNSSTRLHLSQSSPHKKRVGRFSLDGTLLESFESGAEAAKQMRERGLRTNAHIILQICNERPMKCRDGIYRLRKTTAGFVWRFI